MVDLTMENLTEPSDGRSDDIAKSPRDSDCGGNGVFSDARAKQRAFRKSVDDRKMAGMNTQRPVAGNPASKAVANQGARDADAVNARGARRYKNK
jgi:hypothetical protein